MPILKNFTSYTPENPIPVNVLHLKDEAGADWYESQKNFKKDTLKIVFDGSGVINSASTDVSALWPVGQSVAEVSASGVPKDFDINGGWVFDGEEIITRIYTSDEFIAQAKVKRDALIATATAAIAPLQDAVDIDQATDDEIALLKEWKKYRVALSRLDLSTAPDIEWPESPV